MFLLIRYTTTARWWAFHPRVLRTPFLSPIQSSRNGNNPALIQLTVEDNEGHVWETKRDTLVGLWWMNRRTWHLPFDSPSFHPLGYWIVHRTFWLRFGHVFCLICTPWRVKNTVTNCVALCHDRWQCVLCAVFRQAKYVRVCVQVSKWMVLSVNVECMSVWVGCTWVYIFLLGTLQGRTTISKVIVGRQSLVPWFPSPLQRSQ